MEDMSIRIERPVYNQKQFKKFLNDNSSPSTVRQKLKQFWAKHSKCSAACFLNVLLSYLPFVNVLKTYKWKQYLPGDIIAGLSVGVIHIPQSMGFGVLTSLPPYYGLYSSLYPIILYFVFGTSRHISVGTTAVINIMIGAVVETEYAKFTPNLPANATQSEIDQAGIDFKLDVATSMTLIIGAVQLGMGVLRLGFLVTFMSLPFIGGLLTGAAFHITTSQLPFMLGISIPLEIGVFRLPKNWYWICRNLPKTNVADLVLAISSMVVLIVIKEIINEKFKKRLKIPIPAELLIVVFASLASYLGNMKEKYSIKIIENIPVGLPAPRTPSLNNMSTYTVNAIAIAVVSYVISMSQAKLMSHMHRYSIDQNQELLAHGFMHAVGSFLSSFGGTATPSRTLVHYSSGGKTMLASLVSAGLILLVCLVMGPLFEPLPYSALGTTVVISILPLFKQFRDLTYFWKLNRYDSFVWVVTWLSSVLLDMDYGLYIGMGISLLTVVIATSRGKATMLRRVQNTEIHAPKAAIKEQYKLGRNGTAIFQFSSPLYFANVDSFKKQLYAETVNPLTHNDNCAIVEINVTDEVTETISGRYPSEKTAKMSQAETATKDNSTSEDISIDDDPRCVVIDCSAITYVDSMGVNALKQVSADYASSDIYLVFANCSQDLLRQMALNDMDVTSRVFPSVIDATTYLDEKNNEHNLFVRF